MADDDLERPLRIGLLTHSVNPRGGVVHTLELARALHEAGHAVTVFAPAAPGQRFFREPPCRAELVPVHGTPADTVAMVRTRIAAFVDHLGALLEHERFDVLHTHDPSAAMRWHGCRTWAASRASCARSITSTTSPMRSSRTGSTRPSFARDRCSA
jgi:Glycosyl transferase 4-like domain